MYDSSILTVLSQRLLIHSVRDTTEQVKQMSMAAVMNSKLQSKTRQMLNYSSPQARKGK